MLFLTIVKLHIWKYDGMFFIFALFFTVIFKKGASLTLAFLFFDNFIILLLNFSKQYFFLIYYIFNLSRFNKVSSFYFLNLFKYKFKFAKYELNDHQSIRDNRDYDFFGEQWW